MLVRTLYTIYIYLKHARLFSWWLKPVPNLHHSHSLEPQIFHLELQVSGIDALMQLQFNIARHVMMAQEEVELHQHQVSDVLMYLDFMCFMWH